MPRANRHFVPGYVWHITQRCHKKEFLLKFRKDKRAWIRWAYEAKVRFGLAILNFVITSNHIHLLAMIRASLRAARSRPVSPLSAISRALQLVESRVAQEFNARKDRHGAFWEDRYHATAVESGPQLTRCLTYIDMNMVRARVVAHPRDWRWGGYAELTDEVAAGSSSSSFRSSFSSSSASPPPRPAPGRPPLSLVDTRALMDLLAVDTVTTLLARRDEWIDTAIRKAQFERDPIWTESLAVGSEQFVSGFQAKLGRRIGVSEIVRADPDDGAAFLRRTRGNPIFVLGAKNDD